MAFDPYSPEVTALVEEFAREMRRQGLKVGSGLNFPDEAARERFRRLTTVPDREPNPFDDPYGW